MPAPFKENYDRVLNRKLDALMDITRRPDREPLFAFTRPYIVIRMSLSGGRGGTISGRRGPRRQNRRAGARLLQRHPFREELPGGQNPGI